MERFRRSLDGSYGSGFGWEGHLDEFFLALWRDGCRYGLCADFGSAKHIGLSAGLWTFFRYGLTGGWIYWGTCFFFFAPAIGFQVDEGDVPGRRETAIGHCTGDMVTCLYSAHADKNGGRTLLADKWHGLV